MADLTQTGSSTSAGTTIGVSLTLPATLDAAGFGALAFTTIGGIESIPAFGAAVGENSFQPLNGPQETHKGAVNYGTLQLPMAYNKLDAGQRMLATLAEPDNNAQGAFIVTFANGDKRYFLARAFGMPETVGGATNVLMANTTLRVNTKVVKVNAV